VTTTIKNKNMVNINTVYQRVLAIANKEQRGYITPQEFNLFANQAQLDIFEQYFYDLNQFQLVPGNDTTYSDMIDLLNEKIDIFERFRQPIANLTGAGVGTWNAYYRMGELYYKYNGQYIEIEKIDQNQIHHIQNSPLIAPIETRPCYVQLTELTFQIYPITINDADEANVVCNYVVAPADVNWGYVINSANGSALYNATTSVNFELHASEETELVIKILELAGIQIKDPQIYQIAAQEEAQNVQQEK
jgi:hypothetical protein